MVAGAAYPFAMLSGAWPSRTLRHAFYCGPAAGDREIETARPRPGTKRTIPAGLHLDDTSRIQIVRPECDPFTHAFWRAMGRRVGAEVSVNTSLNVVGPIVQTPEQALEALRRTKAMDGLLLIGEEGGVPRLAYGCDTTEGRWRAAWGVAGAVAGGRGGDLRGAIQPTRLTGGSIIVFCLLNMNGGFWAD